MQNKRHHHTRTQTGPPFTRTAEGDVPKAKAEQRGPHAALGMDAAPAALRGARKVLAHQVFDVDLLAVVPIIPIEWGGYGIVS